MIVFIINSTHLIIIYLEIDILTCLIILIYIYKENHKNKIVLFR